jgi:hypothetical protein
MGMSPAVSAIALICMLFWSEAFAQVKTYWYCQFTPFGQQNARYLSDVFGPTENGMSVGGSTQQKHLGCICGLRRRQIFRKRERRMFVF